MQHVIHGDRDLLRDFLHEGELCFLIDSPLQTPESHRAQTSQRRGQGNHAKRLDAILAQHWHQFRETIFSRHVLHHQGLLSLPHQPSRRFINGQFETRSDSAGYRHREDMQAHDLARGVMQDQIDVIERNEARESLGEIMKQLAQVAVQRNGFGDLQEET